MKVEHRSRWSTAGIVLVCVAALNAVAQFGHTARAQAPGEDDRILELGVIERTGEGWSFRPQGSEKRYAFDETLEFQDFGEPTTVMLEGVVGPGDGRLRPRRIGSPAFAAAQRAASILARAGHPKLLSDIADINSAFLAVVSAGGDGESYLHRVNLISEALESAIGLREITAQDQEDLLSALEDVWAEERRAKAYYGRKDLFRPATYQEIYRVARSTVAVARAPGRRGAVKDSQVFCSGALIGPDLVLTCAHDVERFRPDELEVRFDYELDLDGKPLDLRRYPVTEVVAQGGAAERGALDFSILRIGVGPDERLPGAPPLALTRERVMLGDGIYVIGHPQAQPRLVADNAYVLFPYEVTRSDLDEILSRARSRYKGDTRLPGVLKQLQRSYLPDGASFVHRSVRWWKSPTIGADCDTFHGNSGSPAFSKASHAIVGVLFAGEPDDSDPWRPGWTRHEAILPISVVLDALEHEGKLAGLNLEVR